MTKLQLDQSIPFVNATLNTLENGHSIIGAVEILRQAEKTHQITFCIKSEKSFTKEIPIESYSNLVEPRLFNFLSTTHVVMGGYDYNKIDVLLPEGIYLWSFREWGHTISEWANKTKWLGSETWNYLDFYGGLNSGVVDKYDEWLEIVMKVIDLKSKSS